MLFMAIAPKAQGPPMLLLLLTTLALLVLLATTSPRTYLPLRRSGASLALSIDYTRPPPLHPALLPSSYTTCLASEELGAVSSMLPLRYPPPLSIPAGIQQ